MKLAVIVKVNERWMQIRNPTWKEGFSEFYASQMIGENSFVDYVEWRSGKSVYRVIRKRDLKKYDP